MAIVAYTLLVLTIVFIYSKQIIRHKKTIDKYKQQLNTYKSLVPDLTSVIPFSHYKEVLKEKEAIIEDLSGQVVEIKEEVRSIKSNQQSKSVRLGLISENVLPFHSNFKYNVKDLVPMFRPIDYVVFSEDEVVFLEIKIGKSRLSEKQKKIKNLINSGKVRFEEHRIDESGYIIKESHGKEAES